MQHLKKLPDMMYTEYREITYNLLFDKPKTKKTLMHLNY